MFHVYTQTHTQAAGLLYTKVIIIIICAQQGGSYRVESKENLSLSPQPLVCIILFGSWPGPENVVCVYTPALFDDFAHWRAVSKGPERISTNKPQIKIVFFFLLLLLLSSYGGGGGPTLAPLWRFKDTANMQESYFFSLLLLLLLLLCVDVYNKKLIMRRRTAQKTNKKYEIV